MVVGQSADLFPIVISLPRPVAGFGCDPYVLCNTHLLYVDSAEKVGLDAGALPGDAQCGVPDINQQRYLTVLCEDYLVGLV